MEDKDYTGNISDYFEKFSRSIQNDSPVPVLSISVVGSVLTPEFLPDQSDINSIIVLKKIDLPFLDCLVTLGKEYSKQRIAAPLLMTPDYIETSLDVFPIEFLNFRTIHHTVYGSDYFRDLSIERSHLRLQCEREIKSKLLWLHQSYIESLGSQELLLQRFTASITGFIPLFRAILYLAGHEITPSAHATVDALESKINLDRRACRIFRKILQFKTDSGGVEEKNRLESMAQTLTDSDQLADAFALYYHATQQLVNYVEKSID